MDAGPKNSVRTTIYFSGRVQGVGFRATVANFAKELPLAGTVRNLADGRVELVLEGPPAAADALVLRLREHFGRNIRNIEQSAEKTMATAAQGAANVPGRVRVIY